MAASLPPGFTLDVQPKTAQGPALPPGFTLDKQGPSSQGPNVIQSAMKMLGLPPMGPAVDYIKGIIQGTIQIPENYAKAASGVPMGQITPGMVQAAVPAALLAVGKGPATGAGKTTARLAGLGNRADEAATAGEAAVGNAFPPPSYPRQTPPAVPGVAPAVEDSLRQFDRNYGVGEPPPMPTAQAQTSSKLAGGVQKSLNASQAPRAGGRFVSPEAPITDVAGGPTGKLTSASVNKFYEGVNPSGAETNAALREFPDFGLGSRAAPMEPPPPPPSDGVTPPPEPSPFGARPPAKIEPNEIRAFLTKNKVPQAEIDAAVQEHAAFVKGEQAPTPPPSGNPPPGAPPGTEGTIPTIPTVAEKLTKAAPKAPSAPRTTSKQQLNALSVTLNKEARRNQAGVRMSSAAAPTNITAPMDIAPATQQAADAFGLIIRRIIRDEIVPHGLAEAGKRFAGRNPGAAMSVIKKMVGSVAAVRRLLRIFGLSP